MKNFLASLMTLLVFLMIPLLVFGQVDVPAEEVPLAVIIIGVIVAGAEVVLRLIPKKSWTGILGLIINVLKMASDWLNREDPAK